MGKAMSPLMFGLDLRLPAIFFSVHLQCCLSVHCTVLADGVATVLQVIRTFARDSAELWSAEDFVYRSGILNGTICSRCQPAAVQSSSAVQPQPREDCVPSRQQV